MEEERTQLIERRKRGRPRSLSVEALIDAVLDDGIATFSMPTLGKRLGVAHSGLYRYVRDREELLVLALERISDHASWPSPELSWRDQVLGIANTLWVICQERPGYAVAAMSAAVVSPGYVAGAAARVESLRGRGLDAADAIAAVEVVATLVFSASIDTDRRILRRQLDSSSGEVSAEVRGLELQSGRAHYLRQINIYADGLDGTADRPVDA